MKVIGIRREDKSPFERRAVLTPAHVKRVVEELGIQVVVQPSPIRIFTEEEYIQAGARIQEDLSSCDLVLGVKEIPVDLLIPGMRYAFFSHTIKAQSYNMPMLGQLMKLGCTLLDYERIVDDSGRRLVFFGYYAGLAGMVDSLWTLGKRLALDGVETPLAKIQRAHEYHDLADVRSHLEEIGHELRIHGIPYGIQPLVIGFTGYGNVSRGAQSILDHLPVKKIRPRELLDGTFTEGTDPQRTIYKVVFREEHLVERQAGGEFNLLEYYDHPDRYKGVFEQYLDSLTMLINCVYWEECYPRLMSLEKTRQMWSGEVAPKLKVVGDISCDISGAIEATLKSTSVDKPVFVYDVDVGGVVEGLQGKGPAIMAVDILPTELPRDSSQHFGDSLMPFLKQMVELDPSIPFEKAAIQPELRPALILWSGELNPEYSYLEEHV